VKGVERLCKPFVNLVETEDGENKEKHKEGTKGKEKLLTSVHLG